VGALTLDVPSLGAHYYTSNLHKWACTAKGSAFLWVAPSEQRLLLPLVTSHGYGLVRPALLRSQASAAKGSRKVLAAHPSGHHMRLFWSQSCFGRTPQHLRLYPQWALTECVA
jgi:hypothetical protein